MKRRRLKPAVIWLIVQGKPWLFLFLFLIGKLYLEIRVHQKKTASSFAIWRNLGKVPKNFFQTFPLEFFMNIMAFVCFP